MKKIILAAFSASLMMSCSNSGESNPKFTVTKEMESIAAPIQTREYKGGWAGIKYSVTKDSMLFTETNHSDSYHDFKINSGGSVPGYISITTVKMDSAMQKPYEIVNNLHKNMNGKVLGELQKEIAPEKLGENEVYLFQDKGMSGFAQDAIIVCKGEAIHVKFQSQGPEVAAMAKDKEAFKTFLSSIRILEGKL
jgi:hypothetical protein